MLEQANIPVIKKVKVNNATTPTQEQNKIDNSNFKKTHKNIFEEVGTASTKRSGRPPKIFKLR